MKKLLYPFLTVTTLATVLAVWCIHDFYSAGSLENPSTVILPQGTHFTDISDILSENHIIRHPLIFRIFLFASGKSSRIKAGEYAFPAHVAPREVAAMLASGKTVIHHLTVPEGLMTSEILDMIKNNEALAGEITLDVKEGELLPETYYFSRNDRRNEIITRMRHAMQKAMDEAWEGRAAGLPFSDKNQVLVLASIVEKETGISSERPRVAAVYINRLNRGMLLQADPTTAYAVSQGKTRVNRPLTLKDLAMDSPYNTYKYPGLPPSPIANPGKSSILATVHPEQSDELYFVATGTGGHNFARTIAEHNENVRKYRESRH